jgi:ABC-type cobalamin transport system ATPase subunit
MSGQRAAERVRHQCALSRRIKRSPNQTVANGRIDLHVEIARDGIVLGSVWLIRQHDPTLAARFADRVLLLHGDGRWQYGDAATTLSADYLSELYGVPVEEMSSRGRRIFVSV